ncbi:Protein N-terminal methyltransferase [Purpureocillium takamizusanense]|uniref:Alpha N-terminal protein methyltransferase 1 n=1 Tax=Purpureocillium takamizusanense TaxID=2060973 RepID=A0A9Q8VC47_9HYPO|nr:Protein N-terminal methyltransferase [Purpureocillium takamizusanense]UNI19626.1 Protein N-terminal methyltransferase [Purpureocillium takamizusanense]
MGDTQGSRNQKPTAPDGLINTQAGRQYWEGTQADVNGMLGGIPSLKGFGSLSRIDLQGSRTFLARLGIGTKGGRKPVTNALEGGAGIGRITEGLLLHLAEHVDVVEPIAKFTEALKGKPGVRDIFNVGLEEWRPNDGAEYDLIWTQWCLGHLTDEQMVEYLKLCKTVLKPGSGVIVIKENLSTTDVDVFDDEDSSVTRQDATFRHIFEEAGLKLVRTDLQRGFPEMPPVTLLPVRMYALKP